MPSEQDSNEQGQEVTQEVTIKHIFDGRFILRCWERGYHKDTLQSAVQLNKDHQYALNVYTERLEFELDAVDKLLVRFLYYLTRVVIIRSFVDHR